MLNKCVSIKRGGGGYGHGSGGPGGGGRDVDNFFFKERTWK